MARSLAEVQVTGTRVRRDGFEAPTPVKSVSAAQLAEAAPISLVDALVQLPELRNSQIPQNTGINTAGNAGQSFLNLRSLGPERTLILLDGRRVVPSNANGNTDISLLPEGLIKRVDLVTGGASAAYGSDAVAGVVNFVLDTGFTGFNLQGQYGSSDHQDARNHRIALTAGTALLDDRAHVVVSGLVYRNSGVETNSSRDWFRSCSRIANPALIPNQITQCDVHSAQFTRGGLIASGPLQGTQFGADGVPLPFVYGSFASASAMVGGSGEDHALGYQMVPSALRQNAFGRFSYDLRSNVTVFVEALYGRAQAEYHSTAPWQGQATAYTIYPDNAFLPASTRAAMTSTSIASFPLSRYDDDFGPLSVRGRNETVRWVAGIDAKLNDWTFNAYLEDGHNNYRQTIANNVNVNRLYNAADAVVNPATGQIVCRSALTQRGNGCVPLDLFGDGSPSPEALAWVLGSSLQDLEVRQRAFEASIAGSPFSSRAGPESLVFGVGWREEAGLQRTDAVSQQPRTFTGDYLGWPNSVAFTGQVGSWERNNPLPLSGSYTVKEAFLETAVPLVRGAAGLRSLEFNGALRYTDYSTSGGVTSWKGGLVYAPTADLHFRATRSRDIRAPNLTELYRGRINGLSNLTDPFQPVDSPARNPFVLGSSLGNPKLSPEMGDTSTVGVVYQPSWLPGLNASVDYYQIDLEHAITTLGGQRTVDLCHAGSTFLCQYLIRDANGVLIATQSPYLNVASRVTSGLDVELAYRLQADQILPRWPGEWAFRAFGNYIDKLTTSTPGAMTLDDAGENGDGGVPRWSATLSARYDAGGYGAILQEHFIGSGSLDSSLTATMLAPAQNHVASVCYTDLTLSHDTPMGNGKLQAFLTVNNAFNRDPPSAPGAFFAFGTSATNTSLYDVIGRTWTLGVRLTF
jgi:outer membrane receptor protein involved in Fe transport